MRSSAISLSFASIVAHKKFNSNQPKPTSFTIINVIQKITALAAVSAASVSPSHAQTLIGSAELTASETLAFAKGGNRGAVTSKSLTDATAGASFSFDYEMATMLDPNLKHNFLGAGFSNGVQGDLFNDGSTDANTRLWVGLIRNETGSTNWELGFFADYDNRQAFQEFITPGAGDDGVVDFAASAGTFYTMNFDLSFNDTADIWTVSSLEVLDGATTIANVASATFDASSGGFGNVSATNLNALVTANGNGPDIGTQLDNINIAAIPEPSAAALVLGVFAAFGALLVCRRRAQHGIKL